MKLVNRDTAVSWAWFYRAMELESKRPKKSNSAKPTMMELHQEQFGWFLEQARESSEQVKGEDPVLVAMLWARQVGVSPRAIAKVMGQMTPNTIRLRLARLNRRLEGDPALRARLTLA